MEILKNLMGQNIIFLATLIICFVFLSFANWFWLKRHPDIGAEKKLPRQIGLFALTVVAALVVILVMPINDTTRGQILSLIGLVLTGIIALSSTTFVSNAMAGLMLRMVDTFKPGDYLKFNDQLCRVTERGLFHTEVQNDDKDLITYPNLFLITNSVTVISHTGTIITCSMSLGYDIPREKIEKNLILAAESVGLETPFVLIKSLGDFSITYKVSGFLNDVKNLVTWRSNLYKAVLDHLHKAEIEIVSPNYMLTRQLDGRKLIIPEKTYKKSIDTTSDQAMEEKVFDKAEIAKEREEVINMREKIIGEIELAAEQKDEDKEAKLNTELKLLTLKMEHIDADIK